MNWKLLLLSKALVRVYAYLLLYQVAPPIASLLILAEVFGVFQEFIE